MCGYLHQLGQNQKNTLTFSYFVVLFVVVLLMAAYVVISQLLLLLLSSTSLLSSSSPDKNSLIRTVQNIGDSRVKIPTTKTQNPKIQQQQKNIQNHKKINFS